MTKLQAFRNEISNYAYYKIAIAKMKEEIWNMEYMLFGVHGVDPSKVYIENRNYTAIEYEKLIKIEKFEVFKKKKTAEIDRMQKQIDRIDYLLHRMDKDTRRIFELIYINGLSYKETCLRMGLIDSNGKPRTGELDYLMKKEFKERL